MNVKPIPTPMVLVEPATPALPLIVRFSVMREAKPTAKADCPPDEPTPADTVVSPTAPATSGIALNAADIAACCLTDLSTMRNCPILAASPSTTPAPTF